MDEPHERKTSSEVFTIENAKQASHKYIKSVKIHWKRIDYTDLSESRAVLRQSRGSSRGYIQYLQLSFLLLVEKILKREHAVSLTRGATHGSLQLQKTQPLWQKK